MTFKIAISQFTATKNPNSAMEMKQNQTFFHGTYSNLMPYLFLSKNITASRFYELRKPRQWK